MTGEPGEDGRSGEHRRRLSDMTNSSAILVAAGIGLIGAMLGAAATYAAASSGHGNGHPGPTVTATITVPPSPKPDARLQFALTSQERVPWCNTIRGRGAIPAGEKLLIFDASASTPAYYHFDGAASQDSADAWSLKPVYIGEPHEAGLKDIVVGVLVSSQTANFVGSILAGPPHENAFWVTPTLPPGQLIEVDVVRNNDATQCA
jgi:hypothetical protein